MEKQSPVSWIQRVGKKVFLPIIAAAVIGAFASALPALALQTGIDYGTATGLGSTDIRTSVMQIVRIALGFLGIIAIILIIYGGFTWLTSGGNEEKISTARAILRNAAIGLVIILLSFAIVSFIINQLLEATGSTGPGGGSCTPGSCVACRQICNADGTGSEFTATQCTSDELCGGLGSDCTDNAQCGSNCCQGNQCVMAELCDGTGTLGTVQITYVSPDDGAERNFVTIGGQNFGTTPGTVRFLGSATDGDEYVALDPGQINSVCVGNWSNNQIIIAVPEGALDGPIEVIRAVDGESDTTDNDLGPQLDNFDVNSVIRPGICAIEPGLGVVSDRITAISGINFTPASQVLFGQIAAGGVASVDASGLQIEGTTVPSIQTGETVVQVRDTQELSNPINFTVLDQQLNPRIISISPTNGAPGTYVTITGLRFGRTQAAENGRVVFYSGTQEVEANYNFPPECSTSVWQDSQVIVKVPTSLAQGAYGIRIETNNGQDTTEDITPPVFTVNGTIRPNICLVRPDNGPIDTVVTLFGEQLSSPNLSEAIFSVNQRTSVVDIADSQTTEKYETAVPANSVTGPLYVANQSGAESNELFFRVGACADSSACGAGQECCSSGAFANSCMPAGSCGGTTEQSTYTFTFQTTIAPGSCSADAGICDPDQTLCQNNQVCNPTTCNCEQIPDQQCTNADTALVLNGATQYFTTPTANLNLTSFTFEAWVNPRPEFGNVVVSRKAANQTLFSFIVGPDGDVTGDGELNISDVARIAQAAAGSVTLSAEERAHADTNGDGVITQLDTDIANEVLVNQQSDQLIEQSVWSLQLPGTSADIVGLYDFTPNTWYHVAVTVTPGSEPKVYINSQLQLPIIGGGPAPTIDYTNAGQLFVGSDGTRFYSGSLDDIAFHNRVLTLNEISYRSQNRPLTDQSSVVAYWRFNNAENPLADERAQHNGVYTPAAQQPVLGFGHFACTPSGPQPGDSCDTNEQTAVCDPDQTLCGSDLVCDPSSCTCQFPDKGVVDQSTYTFTFGTFSFGPQVLELCNRSSQSCIVGSVSSPAPYNREGSNTLGYTVSPARPNDNDVNIDSVLSVSFTEVLRKTDLSDTNIILQRCNSAFIGAATTTIDASDCTQNIALTIADLCSSEESYCDQVIATPQALLDPGYWYRVTLRASDMYGANGIALNGNDGQGNYRWTFKTQNSTDLSSVGCLYVYPGQQISNDATKIRTWSAYPAASDNICVDIRPESCTGGFAWDAGNNSSVAAQNAATVRQLSPANTAESTAIQDTLTFDPAWVSIDAYCLLPAPLDTVDGYGELTIDFSRPYVVDRFPDCGTACLNSKVGATFSKVMDTASARLLCDSGSNCVKLHICYDDPTCAVTTANEVASFSSTVSLDSSEAENTFAGAPDCFDINNDGNFDYCLLPNTYYRVIIDGTVRGEDFGKTLAGLNYNNPLTVGFENDERNPRPTTDPLLQVDSYSWVFKTQENFGLCQPDAITVAPNDFQANYNQQVPYGASPRAAGDICDPNGQKLNPYSFNWDWDLDLTQGQHLPLCTAAQLEPPLVDFRAIDEDGKSVLQCENSNTRYELRDSCGNGRIDAGEDCDDGNIDTGDGCSGVDAPQPCTWEGSLWDDALPNQNFAICGNGRVDYGEDCDTLIIGSAYCDPITCLHLGNTNYTYEYCGNGIIDNSEQCDPASLVCSNRCTMTGSSDFEQATGQQIALCGDGQLGPGEQCDLGELAVGETPSSTDGDGCSATCLLQGTNLELCRSTLTNEFYFTLNPSETLALAFNNCADLPNHRVARMQSGNTNTPQPVCGNARLEVGEECDTGGYCVNPDGSTRNNPSACSTSMAFACDTGTCRPFNGVCEVIPGDFSAPFRPCNAASDCSGVAGLTGQCMVDACTNQCLHAGSRQEFIDPTFVGAYQVAQTFTEDGIAYSQAWITSAEPFNGPLGEGQLRVGSTGGDGAFTIIDFWPSCVSACSNAAIGAQFSLPLSLDLLDGSNVALYQCANAQCDTLSASRIFGIGISKYPIGSWAGDLDDAIAISLPPTYNPVDDDNNPATPGIPTLLQNVWYRVVVYSNVMSIDEQQLAGLNYNDQQVPSTVDNSFSWTFKTSDNPELCALDRVTVIPAAIKLPDGRVQKRYSAQPWSDRDLSCGPQRLNPYQFDWRWDDIEIDGIDAAYFIDELDTAISEPTLDPERLFDGCGNGVVEPGEDCDYNDPSLTNQQYCTSQCRWVGNPSACANGTDRNCCGNGIVERGVNEFGQEFQEQCDYISTDPLGNFGGVPDYCSASCVFTGNPNYLVSVCGNGIVEAQEECDTGEEPHNDSTDGCTDFCLFTGSELSPAAECGNGIVEPGEECDPIATAESLHPYCINQWNFGRQIQLCDPQTGNPIAPSTQGCSVDQCVTIPRSGDGCTGVSNGLLTNNNDPEAVACSSFTSRTSCEQYDSLDPASPGMWCYWSGNSCRTRACISEDVTNQGNTNWNVSVCGNGIVEYGEVCDDGGYCATPQGAVILDANQEAIRCAKQNTDTLCGAGNTCKPFAGYFSDTAQPCSTIGQVNANGGVCTSDGCSESCTNSVSVRQDNRIDPFQIIETVADGVIVTLTEVNEEIRAWHALAPQIAGSGDLVVVSGAGVPFAVIGHTPEPDFVPTETEELVCRNAQISALFSKEVDIDTLLARVCSNDTSVECAQDSECGTGQCILKNISLDRCDKNITTPNTATYAGCVSDPFAIITSNSISDVTATVVQGRCVASGDIKQCQFAQADPQNQLIGLCVTNADCKGTLVEVSELATGFLDPLTAYQVNIRPGRDGVLSTNFDELSSCPGAPGSCAKANQWNFTTDSTFCSCDYIGVQVHNTSAGNEVRQDVFTCASDECGINTVSPLDDDVRSGVDALSGNQHEYRATCYDISSVNRGRIPLMDAGLAYQWSHNQSGLLYLATEIPVSSTRSATKPATGVTPFIARPGVVFETIFDESQHTLRSVLVTPGYLDGQTPVNVGRNGESIVTIATTEYRCDNADGIELCDPDGRIVCPNSCADESCPSACRPHTGAQANINVTNFICENPWPDIENFPYSDFEDNIDLSPNIDTNFEFYYCRDAGAPGFEDDLPRLNSETEIINSVPNPLLPKNAIKDLIFPFGQRLLFREEAEVIMWGIGANYPYNYGTNLSIDGNSAPSVTFVATSTDNYILSISTNNKSVDITYLEQPNPNLFDSRINFNGHEFDVELIYPDGTRQLVADNIQVQATGPRDPQITQIPLGLLEAGEYEVNITYVNDWYGQGSSACGDPDGVFVEACCATATYQPVCDANAQLNFISVAPAATSGDAIGVRVLRNPLHLSPETWYQSGLCGGMPSINNVCFSDADCNGTSDQSLIAYWGLNEGFGTATRDASQNANHGSFVSNNGFPQWSEEGRIDQAVIFDSSANIRVPDSDSLDITNDISLSAWIFYDPATAPGGSTIFEKHCSYGLRTAEGNNVVFFTAPEGSDCSEWWSPGPDGNPDNRWRFMNTLSVGTSPLNDKGAGWYHIAATSDLQPADVCQNTESVCNPTDPSACNNQPNLCQTGAKRIVTIYVDGEEVLEQIQGYKSVNLGRIVTNDNILTFGIHEQGGFAYKGQIDEARIYSRVLQQEEIRALMTTGGSQVCEFNLPVRNENLQSNLAQVDGYQALADGRSIYVGASNLVDTRLFSNTYVMSYNQDADASTIEIFNRINDPQQQRGAWKFNTNVNNNNTCVTSGVYAGTEFTCGPSTTIQPVNGINPLTATIGGVGRSNDYLCRVAFAGSPTACNAAQQQYGCTWNEATNNCDALICQAIRCDNNFQCPDLNCSADQEAIVRDSQRFGDLRDIQLGLRAYQSQNSEYPTLAGGSYIPNTSFSVWPSWNQSLGSTIGGGLPTDPINQFFQCPGGSELQSQYCWNESTQVFSCPADVFAYGYLAQPDGSGYSLYANFEYQGVGTWRTADGTAEPLYELPQQFTTQECRLLDFDLSLATIAGGTVAASCEDDGGDQDLDGICDLEDNCSPATLPVCRVEKYCTEPGGVTSDNCTENSQICRGGSTCEPYLGLCQKADQSLPNKPCNTASQCNTPGYVANCIAEQNFNCYNPSQEDSDFDGLGDACDNSCSGDIDFDGVCDEIDNCRTTANRDQADRDADGQGDACDICTDFDGDNHWDWRTSANRCPQDNVPSGYCPDDQSRTCIVNSDCATGACVFDPAYLPPRYCANNPNQACASNSDCGGNQCINNPGGLSHPTAIRGYLANDRFGFCPFEGIPSLGDRCCLEGTDHQYPDGTCVADGGLIRMCTTCSNISIVFSSDLSGSMGPATDPNSRMFKMKQALEQTVDILYQRIPNIKIGLTSYGTTARTDTEVCRDSLCGQSEKNIVISAIRSYNNVLGGTNHELAMAESYDVIKEANSTDERIIVLLTDGETHGGSIATAIQTANQAKSENMTVFTLIFNTPGALSGDLMNNMSSISSNNGAQACGTPALGGYCFENANASELYAGLIDQILGTIGADFGTYNPFQEDSDDDRIGYIGDDCIDFDQDGFGDYPFFTRDNNVLSSRELNEVERSHFQGCQSPLTNYTSWSYPAFCGDGRIGFDDAPDAFEQCESVQDIPGAPTVPGKTYEQVRGYVESISQCITCGAAGSADACQIATLRNCAPAPLTITDPTIVTHYSDIIEADVFQDHQKVCAGGPNSGQHCTNSYADCGIISSTVPYPCIPNTNINLVENKWGKVKYEYEQPTGSKVKVFVCFSDEEADINDDACPQNSPSTTGWVAADARTQNEIRNEGLVSSMNYNDLYNSSLFQKKYMRFKTELTPSASGGAAPRILGACMGVGDANNDGRIDQADRLGIACNDDFGCGIQSIAGAIIPLYPGSCSTSLRLTCEGDICN